MIDHLILYIFGFLTCSNLLFIWYGTPFGEEILSKVFKINDIISYEEIIEKISLKNKFLSELFSCPVCFGTWFSFLVSAIIFDSLLMIFICTFSWPTICYKVFLK